MRRTLRLLSETARMALLLALILLAGLLVNGLLGGFALWRTANTLDTPRLSKYADALTKTEDGYALPEALCRELNQKGCWAMLVDGDGKVVWQQGKPGEVPGQFTLADVAGFTRWYLADYPVRVQTVGDGLLVMASPKNSVWKYDLSTPMPTLLFWPVWLLLTLICNFLLIFILAVWMTSRRYKARDAARTEWIAAVSHDVRTPLSTVLGYAGEMESDEALPQKDREAAALIRQKGEELRGLIADLNLTNRLMHSMEPLQRSRLSLAALMREAAAQLLNDQADERCGVEVDIAPDAQRWQLCGDKALIMRMLKNLLGNSVRHNPEGCTITLALKAKAGGLRLTVSDDGCGYSKEQLNILSKKAAPVTSGHGLGLTIVRQIVLAHGGRIRFCNTERGGACAIVHFGVFCVRRARPKPLTQE